MSVEKDPASSSNPTNGHEEDIENAPFREANETPPPPPSPPSSLSIEIATSPPSSLSAEIATPPPPPPTPSPLAAEIATPPAETKKSPSPIKSPSPNPTLCYRLKAVHLHTKRTKIHILLQNENGPCPLIAATNCLLLRRELVLERRTIRSGVITTEEVVGALANYVFSSRGLDDGRIAEGIHKASFNKRRKADDGPFNFAGFMKGMKSWALGEKEGEEIAEREDAAVVTKTGEETESDVADCFFIDELMEVLPTLQYGLDVNPRFTAGVGISGYEYTPGTAAFDALRVDLVHGWLADPQDRDICSLLGNASYNELVEIVVSGSDAKSEAERLRAELETKMDPPSIIDFLHDAIPAAPTDEQLEQNILKKEHISHQAFAIRTFLEETSHQLTYHGLSCLHEHLHESQLAVFFRNNHFSTILKHSNSLYLLVTDMGYATVDEVIWERLDEIDGDTEYVDADFVSRRLDTMRTVPVMTAEGLLRQREGGEMDYQLALGMQNGGGDIAGNGGEDEAVRQAKEASLMEYNRQMDGLNVGGGDGVEIPNNSSEGKKEGTIMEDMDREMALRLQAESDEAYARQISGREHEATATAAAPRSPNPNATANRKNSPKRAKKEDNCVIS